MDTANQAFKENEDKIRTQFLTTLAKPESDYFRKISMQNFGLIDSPDCNSTDKDRIDKCNYNIAIGLTSMAKAEITGVFSGNKFSASTQSLSDRQYILQNKTYKDILASLKKDLLGKAASPENEKKVKDLIFPKIKKLLAQKVNDLPIDEKKKSIMMDKIKGIQYAGTNCEELAEGMAADFIPNAFYSPAAQTFTICGGYLGNNFSDFKIARTIAHELAHSIDPCRIESAPEGMKISYTNKKDLAKMEDEYPIKGLIACLRSEKSIMATRQPQSPKNSESATSSSEKKTTDNKETADKPYSFCDGDQITESVADWFGDEVLVEYISQNYPELTTEQWQNGASNVFRQVCTPPSASDVQTPYDHHPEVQARIDRLLLVNPSLRKKMGCTKSHSKFIYCDAKNPDSMAKLVGGKKECPSCKESSPQSPAKNTSTTIQGGVR